MGDTEIFCAQDPQRVLLSINICDLTLCGNKEAPTECQ